VEWLLFPIAYHITFGTYGTRLHGDDRGTIDRKMNKPGEPIVGSNPDWWESERDRLNFPPVQLNAEQMRFAESTLPSICARGGWTLHTCAAAPDHLHVVLSTRSDGAAVRKWMKRWLGEAMSEHWPLPGQSAWWAEGGSVRWVWTQEYFDDVKAYVHRQRATHE